MKDFKIEEIDFNEQIEEKLNSEKIDLDDCEVLEEATTPSFGFSCPHGWFGAYCH
ncbi:TPA: hypothetical protein ACGXCQ_001837 [Streptococcus pyogenes]|uniref:hypothetical protein n=1 Tax=Bacillota TaxID=1239 RepID=UPI0002E2348C|nr:MULTISPECIES: hypothetical protein [Bacillota]MDU2830915.1 hypothetical protein [Anaerococcus sp.]HBM7176446.1 hypothetical protein [Enterococcus faecium]HES0992150.1 hypothetical protein [Streptococcus pyogenes]MCU6007252.1 hypothetical protein [Clostridioides difficile]MDU4277900.1 hypothetical protein [Finegoldia magna]